jgi:hypothetical protein
MDAQQKKKEVDAYNQNNIEAMYMFEGLMKIDPNRTNHAVDFTKAREFLRQLYYGRLPPSIQEEMLPNLPEMIRCPAPLVELVQSVLYRGHLNARIHPWMLGWSMVMGKEQYTNEDSFYIQRYQGTWRWKVVQNHPQLFQRVGAMIMSDPDTNEPLVVEYHRDIRTHFSNAPTFPNHSHRNLGPTHIALGFNDLQILLHFATTHQQQQQQLLPSTSSNDVPIRFIGYDRSTYSIAKSLVITHMLSSISVTPHHIVEAWYSSTWSYETLILFRYSCITLLNQDDGIMTQTTTHPSSAKDEIYKYIYHWAHDATPITETDAIQRWFYESCECGHVYTQTCSFHRKKDRIALLQYFMTGEFGTKQLVNTMVDLTSATPSTTTTTVHPTEMVGSLAMYNVPDWAPPANKTDQDRVNNTILLQSILDELETHNFDLTIMDAMYNIKIQQVTSLQQCVQSGQIQIDVRYGDIQPLHKANPDLLDEIRHFQADTISWSNLVDYFLVAQFHELAQYWSTDTTTHHGYTMNWPTTCYGTSISDYPTILERRAILQDTITTQVEDAATSGVGQLVTVPSFEHTEDVTSDLLSRRLRPTWLSYFRSEARHVLKRMGGNLYLKDEMQLHSPILRTNRSIYLTWKYR